MPEMTPQQLDQFRALLLERKTELETMIANAEGGSQPVSLDQPIGRLSRMDALQQQSMSRASRQAAVQRLDQVKAALHRIDSGAFGHCLECEEEIEAARLRARPEALLCIDCQSDRERKP